MRIYVEVGCELDPGLNVRIDRASGEPVAEPGDELRRVRPSGRVGVDTALAIPGVEVTAFAIGRGHERALRHALAAGAARAVVIGPDEASIASLAEWLAAEAPDLVIAERSLARVAGKLGWAHVAGVASLVVEGTEAEIVRAVGGGDRERLRAKLPAVLRMDPALRPRYIARARIAAVRPREILEVTLPASSATIEVGPLQAARARTRLGAAPAAASATTASGRLAALMNSSMPKKRVAAEPAKEESLEAMAESFVRYLAHHGLLDTR